MKENKNQHSTWKLDYRKIRDTLEYQLRISLLRNNDKIVAITDEFMEIAKVKMKLLMPFQYHQAQMTRRRRIWQIIMRMRIKIKREKVEKVE